MIQARLACLLRQLLEMVIISIQKGSFVSTCVVEMQYGRVSCIDVQQHRVDY